MLEAQYMEKLKKAAPDDLTAFSEYMNPEEPPAPHHVWLCERLMEVERGDRLRMLISLPPGAAKSTYGSRMFPAWYMGRNPKHRYIQAGHTQNFCENEFGKKVRGLIDSEAYKEVFPEIRLSSESKAAGYWALNNPYGSYLTRGVGQAIAGFRAHIAGVDDPFGSREDAESDTHRQKVFDWFSADFTTRLLPNRPMFVIATRWHSDDLCGRLEEMTKEGKGHPYYIINIPAICEEEDDPLGRKPGEVLWPEFYDLAHYLNLKATLPARDWNSLYQGTPVDSEGGVLKGDWIQRYQRLPTQQENDPDLVIRRIVLSADTASKTTERNDYTVLTIWIETKERKHYLADVIRKRVEFADMCALIDKYARYWKVDAILVEDKGSGTQYIQMKGSHAYAPVVPISTSNQSKEFRFDAVTPMFEAGDVLLPERAPWLADYEKELLQFPSAKYDDQVDSTSQYLRWGRKKRKLGTKKMKAGH